MNEYLPVIIPVFAAFAAILGSWLTVRAGKKKADADATETLTDVAMSLIAPLKVRIVDLEVLTEKQAKEISLLKAENRVLHKWAQVLFTEVIEAGGEPTGFDKVKGLMEE